MGLCRAVHLGKVRSMDGVNLRTKPKAALELYTIQSEAAERLQAGTASESVCGGERMCPGQEENEPGLC